MDTGTDKNNLNWLNPDDLIEFIDELRAAGYKIGISQYIAAQNLILMLIDRGTTLDSPENLRNLLGPILCSSPIEQEEFPQRFDRWVQLSSRTNFLTEKATLETLPHPVEPEKIPSVSYGMQQLRLLTLITIFLLCFVYIILFPSPIEKRSFRQPRPTGETTTPVLPPPATGPLPQVPPRGEITKTDPPETLPLNWQILLLYLTISVAFLILRSQWRANLFLQRYSTTKQPELNKISIAGCEDKLVSHIVLRQIAQSLRYRIQIPSHELDVNKTINATLSRGGWLTPVYRTYQILPEYLFLVNRTSYRDHQAKFVEEIIERLQDEGVFTTIYFFDDDPRMCFPHQPGSFPLRLREITSKYSQHCLIIISDTDNFFSSISGELEPWVNQLTDWENRAFLTPTPVENWRYQELELAQQFIILPATLKGLQVLSQRLRQGVATYFLAEKTPIPLPDSLRTQPYLWIERNPPPSEQINLMLESLEKYLGQDSFYWLSACAVFPELHWNITIYLGNVLTTESGKSLLEVCSLTDLARLPWLRSGYMPDWLRVYLMTTLTPEQQQIIRNALEDLLNTAVQGSDFPQDQENPSPKLYPTRGEALNVPPSLVGKGARGLGSAFSKLQLEIATQAPSFLTKLANSIRSLLSKPASQDSLLRDYLFLGFMTKQSVLTMKVSDDFSRSLQRQKKLRKLGIVTQPSIHQPSFVKSNNSISPIISRRKFLTWLSWGGVGLLTSVVTHQITQNPSRNYNIPNYDSLFLQTFFEFKIVAVNAQGNIVARDNRTADQFVENVGNGVTLQMVAISGGSFLMGSPPEEAERFDSESPQHLVNVPAFFMGKYPVTQAQYQAIMGTNPANFKGDKRPVEQVTWDDAVEFCEKLSQSTGRKYRLPSEAEWEYACRAGTTTPFSFGETITTDLVNYDGNFPYASAPKGESRRQTTDVGNFLPNSFGLYDMHGNIWEWCQDIYNENYEAAPTDGSAWLNGNDNDYRLLRGGSWILLASACRSANRDPLARATRDNTVGFRVVAVAVA